jgi:hypothetical protein
MTEPQKTDHWASLASNLGAEPAPEIPQRATAADSSEASITGPLAETSAPPTFRPAVKSGSAPRRPAKPSAWDQLAGDLGIAPPPPPAPIAPPISEEGPNEAAEEERPTIVVDAKPANLIFEAEVALPVWDDLEPPATEPESFEPQEALDIMDETADEFADEVSEEASTAADSAGAEGVPGEPRPRRRRRRRGRGRGREGAASSEASTVNEFSEELGDDERADCENAESAVDESTGEPAEEGRHEDDRSERRPRRRRRGRGRSRDQVRDEQQIGEEEDLVEDEDFDFDATDEEATVEAETSDEHDFDDEEEQRGEPEIDVDHEFDEDGVESPRIGFRNIPTWKDAIGVMIAKNMESRSRNPGGSRGPGGRGGRGGGGRGRGRRPDRR